MGMLRLLLALSVVLAHTAWSAWPVPPLVGGTLAVQAFFILSGFYMALVLTGKYRTPSGGSELGQFWAARLLRLMPSYWLVLAVLLWLRGTDLVAMAGAMPPWLQLWGAVSNLVLVGLDGLLFVEVRQGVAVVRADSDAIRPCVPI